MRPSALLRAAAPLGLARRLRLERAVLDLGAGSVRGDDHAGGGDLRVCELQAGGHRAAVEQALPLAEHEREGPEAEPPPPLWPPPPPRPPPPPPPLFSPPASPCGGGGRCFWSFFWPPPAGP